MNRAVLACLCALAPVLVHAAELPQTFHGSATKERKQYCSTRFTLNEDGSWFAQTTFTNRRRLHGGDFEAVFRLVDSEGEVLVAIKHSAHVHGRLVARHSNRAYVSSQGYLAQDLVPLEDVHVRYACTGRGGIPDDSIVGTLVEIIRSL